MEGTPGEKVWVYNVEAPVRAKALRGDNTLSLAQRIHLNKERERERERERELRTVGNVGWSWSCLLTKKQFQQNLFQMRL